MESQPQNPEFRNNPENFHPCVMCCMIGQLSRNAVLFSSSDTDFIWLARPADLVMPDWYNM